MKLMEFLSNNYDYDFLLELIQFFIKVFVLYNLKPKKVKKKRKSKRKATRR